MYEQAVTVRADTMVDEVGTAPTRSEFQSGALLSRRLVQLSLLGVLLSPATAPLLPEEVPDSSKYCGKRVDTHAEDGGTRQSRTVSLEATTLCARPLSLAPHETWPAERSSQLLEPRRRCADLGRSAWSRTRLIAL